MSRFVYFSDEEAKGLDPELVSMLDLARGKSGIPFTITSGKRNASDNKKTGGVEDSSHLSGKAVDLRCSEGTDRFKMVSTLLAVGFTRLGIYDKHVHCDIDQSKDQNVIWIGISH